VCPTCMTARVQATSGACKLVSLAGVLARRLQILQARLVVVRAILRAGRKRTITCAGEGHLACLAASVLLLRLDAHTPARRRPHSASTQVSHTSFIRRWSKEHSSEVHAPRLAVLHAAELRAHVDARLLRPSYVLGTCRRGAVRQRQIVLLCVPAPHTTRHPPQSTRQIAKRCTKLTRWVLTLISSTERPCRGARTTTAT
jgi:hypothetical protein